MGADSKKKTIIYVLLIVFTILAFSGLGVLAQVYVRQSKTVEENEKAAKKLAQEIADMEEEKETLQKKIEEEEIRKKPAREKRVAKKLAEQKKKYGTEGLEDLKKQITETVAGRDGDWSVYVKNLSTGEYLSYDSKPMKAASLIKLYIMGAVYEQVYAGNMEMSDSITQYLRDMITVNHNESANELVRQMSSTHDNFEEGMKVVNQYTANHDYSDTSQGCDLRDSIDGEVSGENYTSVVDCGRFLETIYKKENLDADVSTEMLEFLKAQERVGEIPAGLPEGIQCANKTGELSDIENDAAIVFGGESGTDYIICVMSQKLSDVEAGRSTIRELSGIVYNYFNGYSGEEAEE